MQAKQRSRSWTLRELVLRADYHVENGGALLDFAAQGANPMIAAPQTLAMTACLEDAGSDTELVTASLITCNDSVQQVVAVTLSARCECVFGRHENPYDSNSAHMSAQDYQRHWK